MYPTELTVGPIMDASAHGRFRRAPKLWNVLDRNRRGDRRKWQNHLSKSQSAGCREGLSGYAASTPQRDETNGDQLCPRKPRGPEGNGSLPRAAPARGYGAKAAWRLSCLDTSVATPLANPGKTMPNGARETRGAGQRSSAHSRNHPGASRAPRSHSVRASQSNRAACRVRVKRPWRKHDHFHRRSRRSRAYGRRHHPCRCR
jgi:hypothetical protein